MHTGFNNASSCLYMRLKRKDLKWYKRIWNIITRHEDRNWEWIPLKGEKI